MRIPAPITVVLLVAAALTVGSDYTLALVLLGFALANEAARWFSTASGSSDDAGN